MMDKLTSCLARTTTPPVSRRRAPLQPASPLPSDSVEIRSQPGNQSQHHRKGGWRTALWCALATLPIIGLGAACGRSPNLPPPVSPPAVVVVAPTTAATIPPSPPTTLAPPSTTSPPVTLAVIEAPPTTAPAVAEAPPAPPADSQPQPTAWDWHEHFSPYDLAPHQLYSNDCGVTAVRAELRAHGLDAGQDEIFDDAIAGHFHAGRARGNGWNGPYKLVEYLQTFGLDAHMEAYNQTNVQALVDEGKPFIVSTDRHYFVISGQEDGRLIAGATGEVVGLGAQITYQQLSGFGGAHRIIVVDSAEQVAPTRPPLVAFSEATSLS